MKRKIFGWAALCALLFIAGCATAKLPVEDILVLEKYKNEIAILKSPSIPPNSK